MAPLPDANDPNARVFVAAAGSASIPPRAALLAVVCGAAATTAARGTEAAEEACSASDSSVVVAGGCVATLAAGAVRAINAPSPNAATLPFNECRTLGPIACARGAASAFSSFIAISFDGAAAATETGALAAAAGTGAGSGGCFAAKFAAGPSCGAIATI
jgi:hypothetical protein